MRDLKLSRGNVAVIFAVVFPIIPYYFEIFGISLANLLCLFLILVCFATGHATIGRHGNKSVMIILIWAICVSLCNVVNGLALQVVYFFMRLYAIYLFAAYATESEWKFNKIISAIVYTFGVISVFGIVEELTRFNIFTLLNTTGIELNYNAARFGLVRILSFAAQTITYGVCLMFVLSLCLYLLQNEEKGTKRRLRFTIIYVLIWLNILMTLSRSVIIFAAISQFMIAYFMGVRKLFSVLIKIIVAGTLIMVFISLVFPEVGEMLKNFGYMILAVFDDSYTSLIADAFGNDNLNAVGNRTDLYQWVAENMNGNWVFGNGRDAAISFAHQVTNGTYTWTNYKTSIEVQYLMTLYRYGFVGLIPEIFCYVSFLLLAFRGMKREKTEKGRTGFNHICFAIFVAYFAIFFAVNQSNDESIFYLFVALFIGYNLRNKY